MLDYQNVLHDCSLHLSSSTVLECDLVLDSSWYFLIFKIHPKKYPNTKYDTVEKHLNYTQNIYHKISVPHFLGHQ